MKTYFAVAVALLLATLSPAHAEIGDPITYTCKDGRRFTLTYVPNPAGPPTTATLKVQGQPEETLKSQRMASGIRYGSVHFEYDEHQGQVTLIQRRAGKEIRRSACHTG